MTKTLGYDIKRCYHGLSQCSICDYKATSIQGNDSGFEKVELPKDMVNQPSHYNYGEIECIDAIKGMLGEEGFKAYCRGNAMKYTWRAGLKFDEVEDLKKASWYNRMASGDDPRLDTQPEDPTKLIYKAVINTKTGEVRPLTEAEQQPGAVTKLGPDEEVLMRSFREPSGDREGSHCLGTCRTIPCECV